MVITGVPTSLPLVLELTEEWPEIFIHEFSSDKGLGEIHEVPNFDSLPRYTFGLPHRRNGE
jgi:hypothetical protein